MSQAPHPTQTICPQCYGAQVQRLTVLHEHSKPTNHAVYGYSWKTGFYSGTVQQRNALEQVSAPPQLGAPGSRWIALTLTATFLLPIFVGGLIVFLRLPASFLFLLVLMGLVYLWYKALRRAAKENHAHLRQVYEPAVERWKRSYYCHQCGAVFDPKSVAS